MQRIIAIAWLTWKAALRFKLFLVLCFLLVAAVVGLPMLIKDDGTARGFTQILLTYTLGTITTLLGLCTLWLACGTLARDIEEKQIQVLATKPIARWQIWLGKWIGIMSLNAVLLAISGASVYGLLQWRATKLPPEEQTRLRNEVLVARGSAKEQGWDAKIEAETEKRFQDRMKESQVAKVDAAEVKKQIREKLKAEVQVVPPGSYRPWKINLGVARFWLRDQPLYLRVKFNAAEKSPSGTFGALWQAGVPDSDKLWRSELMSLAPDTHHEIEITPNLFDDKGDLTVVFLNPNQTALLFPMEDGMEVLYREGSFAANYIRGLGIIFCWMAVLATLGLAAASFLSFPVAAFFSLAVLTLSFSSGIMANVVSEGSILGMDHEGQVHQSFFDIVIVPVFRGILETVNLVQGFSPIDALSTGRSIPWAMVGQAFAQIVLLLCGIIGLIGILIFNRRELATAQGTQ